MIEAVLLDIDGTLIDNNLLHVLAWQRAFRRVGKQVDANTILHKVGMGGDQLAPSILGKEEGEEVEQVRQFHSEEYSKKGLIDHSEPLPGAVDLLKALRARGVKIALASSAKEEEVDHYLKQLGGRQAVDVIVTSKDVSATKPAGDVFARALEKLGKPSNALVVGDTVYDVASASKLGLPCIGVLSGGIEFKLLIEAGAVVVYEGPADLLARLDEVLNRPNLSNLAARAYY
jgi:HAD superfamily hydrolase (TIGR01549 family)